MNFLLFFWGVVVGGTVMYAIYKDHEKKYFKILDIVEKDGDNAELVLINIKKTLGL